MEVIKPEVFSWEKESQVYLNLTRGVWSIKQKSGSKWVVVAYAKNLTIKDVTCVVRESRRQAIIKAFTERGKREKEVHAWFLCKLSKELPSKQGKRITYSPYNRPDFYEVESGKTWEKSSKVSCFALPKVDGRYRETCFDNGGF